MDSERGNTPSRLAPFLSILLLLLTVPAVVAGSLTARLSDHKGQPVDRGVVVAKSLSGSEADARPATAVMDQIDETFVPHVLPILAGTAVSFPNQDDIRHHVYSFSEAKQFELPLYKGTPAEPVVFDKPGEVVLGCNIHDHMRGYLYVVESPYFAVSSEEGLAEIRDVPEGSYEVSAWHPRQKSPAEPRTVQIKTGENLELDFEVRLKPALRLRGAKAAGKKY